MKTSNKKGTSDKRFSKIVNHIVQKSSPQEQENAMAVKDEADAIDQEDNKKPKLKPRDPNPKYLA